MRQNSDEEKTERDEAHACLRLVEAERGVNGLTLVRGFLTLTGETVENLVHGRVELLGAIAR